MGRGVIAMQRWTRRAFSALAVTAGLLGTDATGSLGDQASPARAQSAGVVYLTFDDGPSAYTSSVLDVLNRYGAKATFFVIGQQVGARAATMRSIAANGHAIGNHTWSHPDLRTLSDAAIRDQLTSTNGVIASTVGSASPCMRPPYGALNDRVRNVIAGLGMTPVLWSIDTNDWSDSASVGSIVGQLNNAGDGSVILLHDGGGNQTRTVQAVDQWLAANVGRFEFRPLPGCGGVDPEPPPPPLVTGNGVSAVAGPNGWLDLLTRAGDGSVIVNSRIGAEWSGWGSIGGIATADPDATSWGGDRLDVVVRGVDGTIWHRVRDSGTWYPWESLGGIGVGSPAIVASEVGRVDVFVRGLNGELWTKWYAGGQWHGWVSLGGGLTSSPDAVSYGPGELDVYVRGGDLALWQLWSSGGSWQGWARIGGILTSAPGATTLGSERVDLFVRGLDGAMWHAFWHASIGWYAWDLGVGRLDSAPDAVWRASNWLDVFMRGLDGNIWHMTWDGTAWHGPMPTF